MVTQPPCPAPIPEELLEEDGFVTVYPPLTLSFENDTGTDEDDALEP